MQILIDPSEVYDIFISEFVKSKNNTEIEIGRAPELGTSISIGISTCGEPIFYIYMDDDCIDYVEVEHDTTKEDMDETVEWLINEYLGGQYFASGGFENEMDEREAELEVATDEFLDVAMRNARNEMTSTEYRDMLVDCQEAFLAYLHKKHGIDIYRPSEDENGRIHLYPYDN